MKESMHEEIIGAGVSSLFIERMKLEGWLPIKEYFKMEKLGIELDWVLVLTMENDGFIAVPTVAEYCVHIKIVGENLVGIIQKIKDWMTIPMLLCLSLLKQRISLMMLGQNCWINMKKRKTSRMYQILKMHLRKL